MYMCVDERVAEDMADEINALVPTVRHAVFPDIHPSGRDFRMFIPDAENVLRLSLDWKGFHLDLPRAGLGGTVAHVGLQVLCHLGFSPIYLIGVDMNYTDHPTAVKHDGRNWTSLRDDDPNHFDPRYFGKGRKYHYPTLTENMLPSLNEAGRILSAQGVEVFNAGVGGNLEYFPRVDFRGLFDLSAEEEADLALAAVAGGPHSADLAVAARAPRPAAEGPAADTAAVVIDRIEDWSPEADVAVAFGDTGWQLVPRALFTHVPLGPLGDRYLFVKRRSKTLNAA
jgi:hypothetical protein